MSEPSPQQVPHQSHHPLSSGYIVFLAVLVFFLYFYRSSAVGLVGPDEPRYAQVAREMLRSGDWITPHLMSEVWFEKPPLYYWLAAASFKIGGINEQTARFPAALFAAGFLVFFGWLGQRLFPGETMRYALPVLLTSLGWIGFARAASMEMLFSSTLAGALLAMGLWLWQGRRRWLLTFFGLLALSTLAKGLAGIILAAAILGIYCLITREWRWLLRVLNPWALTLFAVVALPWYAAMTFMHGDVFIQDFIIKHHFKRFVTDELAHPGPWWFYLPVLLAGLFPWTAHLGALRPSDLRRDNRRLFLLIWVLVTVGFFSLSRGKLPGYVLPALPALALWIGEDWKRASRTRVRVISVLQGCMLLALGLAGSLPDALARGVGRASLSFSGTTVVFGAVALLLMWLAWRGRRFGAAVVIALVLPCFLLWLLAAVAPQVDARASARPIAAAVCGRTFALGDVRRHIRYGLEFYCDRRLSDVPNAEYVLSSRDVLGAQPVQRFPDAGLTLWKK